MESGRYDYQTIADQANDFCKKICIYGADNLNFKGDKTDQLNLTYALQQSNDTITNSDMVLKASLGIDLRMGRCGERTALLTCYFIAKGFSDFKILKFGDHVCIAIGLNNDSDLEKGTNIPEHAKIIDPWLDKISNATDFVTELKSSKCHPVYQPKCTVLDWKETYSRSKKFDEKTLSANIIKTFSTTLRNNAQQKHQLPENILKLNEKLGSYQNFKSFETNEVESIIEDLNKPFASLEDIKEKSLVSKWQSESTYKRESDRIQDITVDSIKRKMAAINKMPGYLRIDIDDLLSQIKIFYGAINPALITPSLEELNRILDQITIKQPLGINDLPHFYARLNLINERLFPRAHNDARILNMLLAFINKAPVPDDLNSSIRKIIRSALNDAQKFQQIKQAVIKKVSSDPDNLKKETIPLKEALNSISYYSLKFSANADYFKKLKDGLRQCCDPKISDEILNEMIEHLKQSEQDPLFRPIIQEFDIKSDEYETEISQFNKPKVIKKFVQSAIVDHYSTKETPPTVTNLANGYNVCGAGYPSMEFSHEESLARCSNIRMGMPFLYPNDDWDGEHILYLGLDKMGGSYRTENCTLYGTLASDGRMIPFAKEEFKQFHQVVVVAPDLRYKNIFDYYNSNPNEYVAYMARAAHAQADHAKSAGSDTLICGALGCGVFMNEPALVALIHMAVFQHTDYQKLAIQFAISGKTLPSVFEDIFNKYEHILKLDIARHIINLCHGKPGLPQFNQLNLTELETALRQALSTLKCALTPLKEGRGFIPAPKVVPSNKQETHIKKELLRDPVQRKNDLENDPAFDRFLGRLIMLHHFENDMDKVILELKQFGDPALPYNYLNIKQAFINWLSNQPEAVERYILNGARPDSDFINDESMQEEFMSLAKSFSKERMFKEKFDEAWKHQLLKIDKHLEIEFSNHLPLAKHKQAFAESFLAKKKEKYDANKEIKNNPAKWMKRFDEITFPDRKRYNLFKEDAIREMLLARETQLDRVSGNPLYPWNYLLVRKTGSFGTREWSLYFLNDDGELEERSVTRDKALEGLRDIIHNRPYHEITADKKIQMYDAIGDYFLEKDKRKLREKSQSQDEIQITHSYSWEHGNARDQAKSFWNTYIQWRLDRGEKVALVYSGNHDQALNLHKYYRQLGMSLPAIFTGTGQAKLFKEIAILIEQNNCRDQVHLVPIPTSQHGGNVRNPDNEVTKPQLDETLRNIAQHKGAGYTIVLLRGEEKSPGWEAHDDAFGKSKATYTASHLHNIHLHSSGQRAEIAQDFEDAYQTGLTHPDHLSLFRVSLTDELIKLFSSANDNIPIFGQIKAAIQDYEKHENREKLWKTLVTLCKNFGKHESGNPLLDLFCRAIAEFDANLRLWPEITTLNQLIIAQQKRDAINHVLLPERHRLSQIYRFKRRDEVLDAKIMAYHCLIQSIKKSGLNKTVGEILSGDEMNQEVIQLTEAGDPVMRKIAGVIELAEEGALPVVSEGGEEPIRLMFKGAPITISNALNSIRGHKFGFSTATSQQKLQSLREHIAAQNIETLLESLTVLNQPQKESEQAETFIDEQLLPEERMLKMIKQCFGEGRENMYKNNKQELAQVRITCLLNPKHLSMDEMIDVLMATAENAETKHNQQSNSLFKTCHFKVSVDKILKQFPKEVEECKKQQRQLKQSTQLK